VIIDDVDVEFWITGYEYHIIF